MDRKTILVLTLKGMDEVSLKTSLLYGDIKRALSMIDGTSTFAEISKRAAPSLRSVLDELVEDLIIGGFVQDKARVGLMSKIVIPAKINPPAATNQDDSIKGDLDFTLTMKVPSNETLRVEAEKFQAKQEKELAEIARLNMEREAQKLKDEAEYFANAQAEFMRLRADQEVEKARKAIEFEKQKTEFEAKARELAERLQKVDMENARLKAEMEIKTKLEAEAKLKAAAEVACMREAQALTVAKVEAERIELKTEQAAAKAEAEQAIIKARDEIARMKIEAQQSVAIAQVEAERAKRAAEEYARATEQAAHKARQEAEDARLKAEQEAAYARAKLEAANRNAELENKSRRVAEAARREAERAAEQARSLVAQVSVQECELAQHALEQQAMKEREEEQKRAKQHALAVASMHVQDNISATKPLVKLDAFDFDALTTKLAAILEPVAMTPHPDTTGVMIAESVQPKFAADEGKSIVESVSTQEDEAAAKELEGTYTKTRSETVSRAVEEVDSHAEYMEQQLVQKVQIKQQDNKLQTRTERKFLPWRGVIISLVVLVLLAAVLLPMAISTQEYANKVEKSLTEKLHQPVHIGKLSMHILPVPQIDLSELYIGDVKQIKVQHVQLDLAFTSLFSDVKRIDRVELKGAELSGSILLDLPEWLQKLATDKLYSVDRIAFSQARLYGDAMQFNDLEGQVDFTQTGQFSRAVLHANAGKYALEIKGNPDGKLEMIFNLHRGALPLLPNWNFDDLTAKGELTRDGWLISAFDARIAEGVLQGNAKVAWKSGWSVEGTLDAKAITLAKLNKLLEGDMAGVGHFKMQAATLVGLTDTAILDGVLVVKKGVISGIDIVETVRLHSKENVPGGRTHFDQLDTAIAYSGGAYRFNSLKITNSVLSSGGNIDIVKQQLSGRLSARLSIQESTGWVDLRVGGAIDNPTLWESH